MNIYVFSQVWEIVPWLGVHGILQCHISCACISVSFSDLCQYSVWLSLGSFCPAKCSWRCKAKVFPHIHVCLLLRSTPDCLSSPFARRCSWSTLWQKQSCHLRLCTVSCCTRVLLAWSFRRRRVMSGCGTPLLGVGVSRLIWVNIIRTRFPLR